MTTPPSPHTPYLLLAYFIAQRFCGTMSFIILLISFFERPFALQMRQLWQHQGHIWMQHSIIKNKRRDALQQLTHMYDYVIIKGICVKLWVSVCVCAGSCRLIYWAFWLWLMSMSFWCYIVKIILHSQLRQSCGAVVLNLSDCRTHHQNLTMGRDQWRACRCQ